MKPIAAVAIALGACGAIAFLPASSPPVTLWTLKTDDSRGKPLRITRKALAEEKKLQTTELTRFDRKSLKFGSSVPPKKSAEEDLLARTEKAGFDYNAMELAFADQVQAMSRGDRIEGTVIQFNPTGALVDIGAKACAFMPLREAALIPISDVSKSCDIDERREFQVISDEDENGQIMLSIRRIEYEKAWQSVSAAQVEDIAFEGEVVGVNRGGVICEVQGLRAFLPGSHLCGALPTEELIGTILPLKFLEVSEENNKLVVSNRRAVVEDQMKELSRGDVLQGVVKAIKPYGAFVEINGMSGLLHISQISYDRVEDINSVLQMNTLIKCMVIDHDKVNGRIALSTKTLEPEPGDMLRDYQKVYDLAEKTAAEYHERMESERKAREEAAKDIVMGLGDDLNMSFGGGSSDLDMILNGGNPAPAPSDEGGSPDLESILSGTFASTSTESSDETKSE